MTAAFAAPHPDRAIAVTMALIRTAVWLDERSNANRMEAIGIVSWPEDVGAGAEAIAASMAGTSENE